MKIRKLTKKGQNINKNREKKKEIYVHVSHHLPLVDMDHPARKFTMRCYERTIQDFVKS